MHIEHDSELLRHYITELVEKDIGQAGEETIRPSEAERVDIVIILGGGGTVYKCINDLIRWHICPAMTNSFEKALLFLSVILDSPLT